MFRRTREKAVYTESDLQTLAQSMATKIADICYSQRARINALTHCLETERDYVRYLKEKLEDVRASETMLIGQLDDLRLAYKQAVATIEMLLEEAGKVQP